MKYIFICIFMLATISNAAPHSVTPLKPSIKIEQLFDWAGVTHQHLMPVRQKTSEWRIDGFKNYAETDMYFGLEGNVELAIIDPESQYLLKKVENTGVFNSSNYNLMDPFTSFRPRKSEDAQKSLKYRHLYSDTTSRLIELQKLTPSIRSSLCAPSWTLSNIKPKLLKPLVSFDQKNGLNNIPESLEKAARQNIDFYLSRQSAAYNFHANLWIRDGNWLAGKEIIDNMLAWVDANGLSDVQTSGSFSCFQCYRHALSILLTLDILRSHSSLTPDSLTKIMNWVEGFLDRIYIFQELPKGKAGALDLEQRNNNHNAVRNQALMAWAILANDPAKFETSIKNGYLRSLETIRNDGSFYWDSQRGNWAIRYSNFMVGNLVNIAEMAFGQGIDLYQIRNSRGKNLHDAIEFLIRAKNDFSVINLYAKNAITNSGGDYTGLQDLSDFSQRKTEWDLWISWMERYRNRFKSINTEIDSLVLASRPMVSETDGLATCLSGSKD